MRNFEDIQAAVINKEEDKTDFRRKEFSKYRSCLLIKNMVAYAGGYYYRNISKDGNNQPSQQVIKKTVEYLIQLVREFRDLEEMRLAALTALRSLIDLISYRKIVAKYNYTIVCLFVFYWLDMLFLHIQY